VYDSSPKNFKPNSYLEKYFMSQSANNRYQPYSRLNINQEQITNGENSNQQKYYPPESPQNQNISSNEMKFSEIFRPSNKISHSSSTNTIKPGATLVKSNTQDQTQTLQRSSDSNLLKNNPFSNQNSSSILIAKKNKNPVSPIASNNIKRTDIISNYQIYKNYKIPGHDPTKTSSKKNGIIKAYAVNTNQGIVRNYNEDRVSIILNIMKPKDRLNESWPTCSFFGIYDGHGGVNCADFLRDHLHQYVNDFKFTVIYN
jgi:hypothetical protein